MKSINLNSKQIPKITLRNFHRKINFCAPKTKFRLPYNYYRAGKKLLLNPSPTLDKPNIEVVGRLAPIDPVRKVYLKRLNHFSSTPRVLTIAEQQTEIHKNQIEIVRNDDNENTQTNCIEGTPKFNCINDKEIKPIQIGSFISRQELVKLAFAGSNTNGRRVTKFDHKKSNSNEIDIQNTKQTYSKIYSRFTMNSRKCKKLPITFDSSKLGSEEEVSDNSCNITFGKIHCKN